MFTRGFSDRANFPLPRLPMIFQTITFGLVIPDINTKVTRVHSHLKLMTQSKFLSGFEIVRIHNQNDLKGFGLIPLSRAIFFNE